MAVLLFLWAQSQLLITEVMSNVRGSEQTCGDRNEYIEIYNNSPDTIDLASYFITDFDVIPDELHPWENESILVKYPNVRIHSTILYPYSYALILDREYVSSDTSGGHGQLYDIPDSTLIMTTDDTTIGDGLANSDPLLLFSEMQACTTSFGTPFDSLDCFPSDPGDGISWERIDIQIGDEINNWYPSLDPDGCTPGRENSTTQAFDLAVEENSIFYIPAIVKKGEDLRIQIWVKNYGLRPTDDYDLAVFDDINNDRMYQSGELLSRMQGVLINAFDSTLLICEYKHPSQGKHSIGFQVEFLLDKKMENNITFKELLVVNDISELAVNPAIFTPDNDGQDDLLQIDYRLPQAGGSLTILIYDTRGKLVQYIVKKEECMIDQGTIFWDGMGLHGPLMSGMYIVYLEYEFNHRLTRAKKMAVLAR
ncbi:hypothetical protein A2Y85_08450 [candidate division WOR-3 bacterium RBG_13_43_14]|uniref:Uncharacterized protein n=1 Tax=candidate division WOR-3 bacterium RBG_13_43_14 TaxID=1802590 RepID=A0A1F4UEX9_UNCW3|nr:MAG: hypothetical protein A2Y85_08450 [candidate division WOR-3 bacterium RBG_13_43_14]